MNQELRTKIIENYDEIGFLERFNISIEELVDAFAEKIIEKEEELEEELFDYDDDVGRAFGIDSETQDPE